MPTLNERQTRKATKAALGATGSVANERAYDKSIVASLTNINVKTKPQIVALTAEATANATDLATAQALANSLKTKYNALLAALKA